MPSSLLPDDIRVFERGWLSSNNILLLGQDNTALVDSGYASHAPQTLALAPAVRSRRRRSRAAPSRASASPTAIAPVPRPSPCAMTG